MAWRGREYKGLTLRRVLKSLGQHLFHATLQNYPHNATNITHSITQKDIIFTEASLNQ